MYPPTQADDLLRQMDYIDVLQCHSWDANTPIEETMDALHDVSLHLPLRAKHEADTLLSTTGSKAWAGPLYWHVDLLRMAASRDAKLRQVSQRELALACCSENVPLLPFVHPANRFYFDAALP